MTNNQINSYQLDLLLNTLESVILHSNDGKEKEELKQVFKILPIPFTKFLASNHSIRINLLKNLFMPESLLENKLQIWIDKLNSLPNNFLAIKLSKILEAVSTGTEKVLIPFWKKSLTIKSQKLWLPTKTDSLGSQLNSYNSSLTNIKSNSWFSIKTVNHQLTNLPMTSFPSSQFSQLGTMEKENTLLRTRKLRLYLNSDQKQALRKWMGTARFLYNRAVDYFRNPEEPYLSKTKLRTKLVSNPEYEWQKQTPQGIREGGVFDAHIALTTNLEKKKQTGKNFHLKFRSRKDRSQTIVLPVDSLKQNLNLYPKLLGRNSCLLINSNEKKHLKWKDKVVKVWNKVLNKEGKQLVDERNKPVKKDTGLTKKVGSVLEHVIRIQMTRTGEWYICVPVDVKVDYAPENQGGVIALDPGVRTFLTGYSPDGRACKIGDQDIAKICSYLFKTDRLKSRIDTSQGKKKYLYHKAWLRRFRNVRNRIKDCHRKTVKYLFDNYDVVILPVFKSQGMSNRSYRSIKSPTVRRMMTWSHYGFQTMLLNKASEYKNKHVILMNEEYTSKTCTNCGLNMNKLGGNRIYSCSNCSLKIDRDLNGARNIYLKCLSESNQ